MDLSPRRVRYVRNERAVSAPPCCLISKLRWSRDVRRAISVVMNHDKSNSGSPVSEQQEQPRRLDNDGDHDDDDKKVLIAFVSKLRKRKTGPHVEHTLLRGWLPTETRVIFAATPANQTNIVKSVRRSETSRFRLALGQIELESARVAGMVATLTQRHQQADQGTRQSMASAASPSFSSSSSSSPSLDREGENTTARGKVENATTAPSSLLSASLSASRLAAVFPPRATPSPFHSCTNHNNNNNTNGHYPAVAPSSAAVHAPSSALFVASSSYRSGSSGGSGTPQKSPQSCTNSSSSTTMMINNNPRMQVFHIGQQRFHGGMAASSSSSAAAAFSPSPAPAAVGALSPSRRIEGGGVHRAPTTLTTPSSPQASSYLSMSNHLALSATAAAPPATTPPRAPKPEQACWAAAASGGSMRDDDDDDDDNNYDNNKPQSSSAMTTNSRLQHHSSLFPGNVAATTANDNYERQLLELKQDHALLLEKQRLASAEREQDLQSYVALLQQQLLSQRDDNAQLARDVISLENRLIVAERGQVKFSRLCEDQRARIASLESEGALLQTELAEARRIKQRARDFHLSAARAGGGDRELELLREEVEKLREFRNQAVFGASGKHRVPDAAACSTAAVVSPPLHTATAATSVANRHFAATILGGGPQVLPTKISAIEHIGQQLQDREKELKELASLLREEKAARAEADYSLKERLAETTMELVCTRKREAALKGTLNETREQMDQLRERVSTDKTRMLSLVVEHRLQQQKLREEAEAVEQEKLKQQQQQAASNNSKKKKSDNKNSIISALDPADAEDLAELLREEEQEQHKKKGSKGGTTNNSSAKKDSNNNNNTTTTTAAASAQSSLSPAAANGAKSKPKKK